MARREEGKGEGMGAETATAENLWTVEETAKYLQMSVSWVYRQVKEGAIPSGKLGHKLRFHPARVREYAVAMGTGSNVIPLRKCR